MSRPKVEIKTRGVDWLMDAAALAGILSGVAVVVRYYGTLTPEIPIHFNLNGDVDGSGGKSMLLIVVGIAIVMFTGLILLTRFPQLHTYYVSITPANAQRQFDNAAMMYRLLNIVIAWMFAYLVLTTMRINQGDADGLNPWFVPLFIFLLLGIAISYTYRSFKLR